MISMKAQFLELQLTLKERLSALVIIRFPFSDTFFYFFSINYSKAAYREM